ncbi:shTK domain protein [Ostertagia ostertagi]
MRTNAVRHGRPRENVLKTKLTWANGAKPVAAFAKHSTDLLMIALIVTGTANHGAMGRMSRKMLLVDARRMAECQCAKVWTSMELKRLGVVHAAQSQVRPKGNLVATTTIVPQQPTCEASEGCYNENVCCAYWSLLGECRKKRHSGWLATAKSRVVIVFLWITVMDVTCLDYHRDCSGWARRGECEKNPWMSENCRASCRTCYSQWDLRTMCRGAVGSVAPVATNRPRQPVVTRPPPAWQHRGSFGRGGMDYEDWGGLMGWGNGAGGGIANGWGGPPPMWQQPFSWFRRARAKRD